MSMRKAACAMVDVGDKAVTAREAVARGSVQMSAMARRLVETGNIKKGDPLQAARLAGIMAAKRTSELIPLCHPLPSLTSPSTSHPIAADSPSKAASRRAARPASRWRR